MTGSTLVVVGGGVRSVVLLERLLGVLGAGVGAGAAGTVPVVGERMRVVVLDPHPPGSGRLWRPDQPTSLVMNTLAASSSVFPDPSVAVAGPRLDGPSLFEWCGVLCGRPSVRDLPSGVEESVGEAAASLPSHAREEAAGLEPWHYPTRALFGHYLRWAFAEVSRRLEPCAVVEHIAAVTVDVADLRGSGGRLEVLLDDGTALPADAVVLALGWLLGPADGAGPVADAGSAGDGVLVAAQDTGIPVLRADSPIDQPLHAVADGSTVLVRGLGMSFFDTVTLLTSGRGGRFEPLSADAGPGGRLLYRPSGREPLILAGSRRGLPFRAQPRFGGPVPTVDLTWFRRAAAAAEPFGEVLRALGRDAERRYYELLARSRPEAFSRSGGAEELLAAADPRCSSDDEWRALLAERVPRPEDRFDPSRYGGGDPGRFDEPGGYAGWFAAFVDDDLDQAALGAEGPVKAALSCFVAARSAMPELTAFGRLGSEHPEFVRYLRFAGTAGGVPPEFRVRELQALLAAGVVRPVGPDPMLRPLAGDGAGDGDGYGAGARRGALVVPAGAPEAPGIPVHAVVEAFLPARSVHDSSSRLLRALAHRGIARPWAQDGTPTGALDIDPLTGALIAADGSAHPALFSVGPPSEEARVFTIIAPVPGTNSPVVREADAVVRAAVRSLRAPHQPS